MSNSKIKKIKGKDNLNKSSNNILSIALDENDTFNQMEESSVINKKKNKNKNVMNDTEYAMNRELLEKAKSSLAK